MNVPDFNRDRWGRPLVDPPNGGKPVAYSRFSSHGQCLEDRFGLEKWKLRTAARGLVNRADLFAQVAACPPEDTKRIDGLVDQALEAGGSSVGAGLGTALHEFCERIDTGTMTLNEVPAPWGHDVAAYLATTDQYGLEIVPGLVECRLVCDELKLAGTADRFYRRPDGRLVCGDLKTGKNIGDNPLSYMVQLAAYARSHRYDPETGLRAPVGDVDLEVGYLIHLPSGKGVCTIYEVDLVAGWEAAHLATQVRTWQKRKGLVTVLSAPAHGNAPAETVEEVSVVELPPTPVPTLPSTDIATAIANIKAVFPGAYEVAPEARVEWARNRAKNIITYSPAAMETLARRWPEGVPTFKQTDDFSVEQLDQIVEVLTAIEAEHGMPFGFPDPTVQLVPAHVEPLASVRPKAPVIDEGPDVADEEVDKLRTVLTELTAERVAVINHITAAAANAGVSLSVRQRPSSRRLNIAYMLVGLSEFDLDIAAAIVGYVTPCTVDTIGVVCGALTKNEATTVARITEALNAGALSLAFEGDGTPVLRGDLSAVIPTAA